MNKGFIFRLLLCILSVGFSFYSFIDVQNGVTELRIQLPKLAKEIRTINEENERLQYEIERFENPQHLMQLARRAEYSHLKHPLLKEIATCKEGIAAQLPQSPQGEARSVKHILTLAIGAAK